MSFFSRLFGSAKPTRDVEAELKRLEAEAESAAPGYVGTAYNRAGDLALKATEPDRALKYYGRAIDAFLEDAQREAARGVANKIIRVRPGAVRTLCTLTWLDLAARHQATALLHLRDYVRAAREAGQHARTATQIFEMARLSPDPEFVDAVADALDSLDFPNRADEVRGWASEGSPGAIAETGELGDACLTAAVRSNDRDQVLLQDVEPDAEASSEAADAEGGGGSGQDEVPVSVPVGNDGAEGDGSEDMETAGMDAEIDSVEDAAAAEVVDMPEEDGAPSAEEDDAAGEEPEASVDDAGPEDESPDAEPESTRDRVAENRDEADAVKRVAQANAAASTSGASKKKKKGRKGRKKKKKKKR